MKNFITFIIPSIGRNTLIRTLNSLKNQKEPNWFAIVGFDGLEKQKISFELPEDSRIEYLYFKEKMGISKENNSKIIHSKAGLVRNKILETCDSEWVAFLDDDDTVTEDYVENFKKQIAQENFDCFIYRMIDKHGNIFPKLDDSRLYVGNVGISFIINLQSIKNSNIFFESSEIEDFEFIKSIHLKNLKIKISNNICYKVNH